MKKILFAYPQMMLGGSTTSLLSLLNEIDTSKYEVDLLLSFAGGPYAESIPSYVNVLPYGYRYQDARSRKVHRLLSLRYMIVKTAAQIVGKMHQNMRLSWQYLEEKDVDFYRDIEEEYDVAIAFLEGQMCKYVANHVKAKRKIAWIHIDYKKSSFDPKYDKRSLSQFDKIVLVSEKCKDSFCECFPELSDRAVVVENILSSKYLYLLASKSVELPDISKDQLNLVTTCRISFASKGLDRAVRAIVRLREQQPELVEKLVWYILGDGGDKPALEKLISDNGLQDTIQLLGMQANPYPYVSKMDLFFLPSLWEGKPMAVTEAQILGLPALVTRYTSAPEQIRNGIDGMIVENSEQGVYEGLQYVLMHSEEIEKWRRETAATRYDNPEEIKVVEDLIDGKGI